MSPHPEKKKMLIYSACPQVAGTDNVFSVQCKIKYGKVIHGEDQRKAGTEVHVRNGTNGVLIITELVGMID